MCKGYTEGNFVPPSSGDEVQQNCYRHEENDVQKTMTCESVDRQTEDTKPRQEEGYE